MGDQPANAVTAPAYPYSLDTNPSQTLATMRRPSGTRVPEKASLAFTDFEHDFAGDAGRLLRLERVVPSLERKARAHDRLELAGIEAPGDLDQLLAVGVD